MNIAPTTSPRRCADQSIDDDYKALQWSIHERARTVLAEHGVCLFETTAADNDFSLFTLYLNSLPSEHRQHHNCNTCKAFFKKFAHLCALDEKGRRVPIMPALHPANVFYEGLEKIRRIVKTARVKGRWYPETKEVGLELAGGWGHLHAVVPPSMVPDQRLKSVHEHTAQALQDFQCLARTIEDTRMATVHSAINYAKTGTVNGPAIVLGPLEKLFEVHEACAGATNAVAREAVLWRALAHGDPAILGHFAGTAAATYLTNYTKLGGEYAAAEHNKQTTPDKYRRTTAAPAAATIAQAEDAMNARGFTKRALQRAIARVESVPNKIWVQRPRAKKAPKPAPGAAGIFANVASKPAAPLVVTQEGWPSVVPPPLPITWARFERDILPQAVRMRAMLSTVGSYAAITHARHPESPTLFKWGNNYAWYTYINGSETAQWFPSTPRMRCVSSNVVAVCRGPDEHPDSTATTAEGRKVFLLLYNCCDRNYRQVGSGLFPQFLRGDLHPYRAVIEQYSKAESLTRYAAADQACGLMLSSEGACQATILVHLQNGAFVCYDIKMWE